MSFLERPLRAPSRTGSAFSLLALLCLAPSPAPATVIMGHDIFNAIGTITSVTNLRSLGVGFDMGPASYNLTRALFFVSLPSPTSPIAFTIHSDNSGNPGTALFSSFTQTTFSQNLSGSFIFEPTSVFELQANLSYWFVLSSANPFSAFGRSENLLPTSSVASFIDYRISATGSVPTSPIPGFFPLYPYFSIEGELIPPPPPPPTPEVPEPSTAWLAIGALALFRLSRPRR